MNDITLLKQSQLFGDKALNYFKEKDKVSAPTDFCLINGVLIPIISTHNINIQNPRTCEYYLQDNNEGTIKTINEKGKKSFNFPNSRSVANRLVTTFDEKEHKIIGKDGNFFIIEYGIYPQDAAPFNIQKELEFYFERKLLTPTYKFYTVDISPRNSEYTFIKSEYFEYEYNRKYYIRATANPYYDSTILSDGQKVKQDDIVWIEVKPIIWTKHEKDDVMITDKCLFSNIKYTLDKKYNGDFENTFLNKYIDDYFSKDIQKKI